MHVHISYIYIYIYHIYIYIRRALLVSGHQAVRRFFATAVYEPSSPVSCILYPAPCILYPLSGRLSQICFSTPPGSKCYQPLGALNLGSPRRSQIVDEISTTFRYPQNPQKVSPKSPNTSTNIQKSHHGESHNSSFR